MARDFNGSSDITYTLNAGQIGQTSETWSFWIYPDAINQYRRPVHLGGTGTNRDRSFEMDDGWGFVFNFDFSTDGGAWSVAKPSTGSWQHYAVTFNGTSTANDPIVYKNGASVTVTERVAPSGTLRGARTDLTIGSEVGSQFWDGRIAELAMWNRILTAGEIEALGKGFSPLFYRSGLKLYLPFFGNDTDENDWVYGVTGSVDAGVTKTAHPRIIYPTPQQLGYIAATPGATSYPSLLSLLGIG